MFTFCPLCTVFCFSLIFLFFPLLALPTCIRVWRSIILYYWIFGFPFFLRYLPPRASVLFCSSHWLLSRSGSRLSSQDLLLPRVCSAFPGSIHQAGKDRGMACWTDMAPNSPYSFPNLTSLWPKINTAHHANCSYNRNPFSVYNLSPIKVVSYPSYHMILTSALADGWSKC